MSHTFFFLQLPAGPGRGMPAGRGMGMMAPGMHHNSDKDRFNVTDRPFHLSSGGPPSLARPPMPFGPPGMPGGPPPGFRPPGFPPGMPFQGGPPPGFGGPPPGYHFLLRLIVPIC
jgi:small nuclear ribonucleoprotein B and B'